MRWPLLISENVTDLDTNSRDRGSIPPDTPYNTVIKPTCHRALGAEHCPRRGGEGKEQGLGLRNLLMCGNHYRYMKLQGHDREERAGEPPARSNLPPAYLPLGSYWGPSPPTRLPSLSRDSAAPNIRPPCSPSSTPLPLTRALLVSNLVSILQARGSEVLIRAPPLPAALQLPPRQLPSARGSRKLLWTRTSGPWSSGPPRPHQGWA